MTASPDLTAAAIALNRFGLGARADDTPPAEPKAWLLAQFEQYEPRPAAWAAQPDSAVLSSELEQERLRLRQQRQANPGAASAPAQNNVQRNAQRNAEASAPGKQPAASQSACTAATISKEPAT